MINRTFDRKNIIIIRVEEDDVNSFLIDLDIDDIFMVFEDITFRYILYNDLGYSLFSRGDL